MAWVAIDSSVRDAEAFGLEAPLERCKQLHDHVHNVICEGSSGLPPGEGAFLPCSFWLASADQQQGRTEDARARSPGLLALQNDVGFLSEEYDPKAARQVSNFPQAYSHLALIETAVA